MNCAPHYVCVTAHQALFLTPPSNIKTQIYATRYYISIFNLHFLIGTFLKVSLNKACLSLLALCQEIKCLDSIMGVRKEETLRDRDQLFMWDRGLEGGAVYYGLCAKENNTMLTARSGENRRRTGE